MLVQAWYKRSPWLYLLWPLHVLLLVLVRWRRRRYLSGAKSQWLAPVPVIVVGNISVGGTGKTPFTLLLCERLKAAGLRPGLVSRGYGAAQTEFPLLVDPDADATTVGDEPLLLARRSGCPLVIDPQRPRAVQHLLQNADVDVVLSDDGMQHYALGRQCEIAIVDAARGFGNGMLMPAGPLREPVERLRDCDFLVLNGEADIAEYCELGIPVSTMRLRPGELVNLADPDQRLTADAWAAQFGNRVHGVAGIGNPDRFFQTLRDFGLSVDAHAFADHHRFCATDLQFDGEYPIVMTEKDAVKCVGVASPHSLWYLPVSAELDTEFTDALIHRIETLLANHDRGQHSTEEKS